MKIQQKVIDVPTFKYVLELTPDELFHLYVLSHLKEGGKQFPLSGRWCHVLGQLYPHLERELRVWEQAGSERLPALDLKL